MFYSYPDITLYVVRLREFNINNNNENNNNNNGEGWSVVHARRLKMFVLVSNTNQPRVELGIFEKSIYKIGNYCK